MVNKLFLAICLILSVVSGDDSIKHLRKHSVTAVESYSDEYIRLCRTLAGCKYSSVALSGTINQNLVGTVLDRDSDSMFLQLDISASSDAEWSALDLAVSVRPWWVVMAMSFETPFYAILRRTPEHLLPNYMYIANRNFPSPATCQSVPLIASIHQDDTWGNRFGNIGGEYQNRQVELGVYHIHVMHTGAVVDGKYVDKVYFAGPSDCTTYHNKWECLFMPTTNCTLPAMLATCDNPNCIPHPWTKGVYTEATAAGTLIAEDKENEYYESLEKKLKRLPTPRDPTLRHFVAMHSTAIPHLISNATTVSHERSIPDPHLMMFYFGLAVRFNFHFRQSVQNIVRNFRYSFDPPFYSNQTCVALHVRMDDRNKPGVDLQKWCDKCATDRPDKFGREYKEGCDVNYSDWMDMGCLSPLPFGVATLEHFLNASLVIQPDVKNVFIMTDDAAWVHHQRKRYLEKLQAKGFATPPIAIHTFPVRPNHRQYTLQAAEDFWASVTIARQCSGFVGHFGSAATISIFNSMCYTHDNKFMECPPVYDIAGRMF